MYSGSDNLGEVAWYLVGSGPRSFPVACKKPNELGLYDMSGNVWEWCLDEWNSDSSRQTAEFSRGGNNGDDSDHVLRGGSWASYGTPNFRPAFRYYDSQNKTRNDIGFRVALVPEKY